MKKVYSLLIAVVLVVAVAIGIDCYAKGIIDKNAKYVKYLNTDERNSCNYLMDKVLDENSILVLGSSELSAADELAYPPYLFNNGNSDFNMVLAGRGYMQSLQHAINIGAYADGIESKKAILIISPQWFTKNGINTEEFASRFLEENYISFLKNPNISRTTKDKVANRLNVLLEADASELNRIKAFEGVYIYHSLNPIYYIKAFTYEPFKYAKDRFSVARAINGGKEFSGASVKVDDIDFNMLLSDAESIGLESCTNNEYGVYDDYFSTYISEQYEAYKNSDANNSYCESPEYDDLRLFLDVCKETNLEPMIVSMPVNGRWYDYTGFPVEDREQYYQNIRDICNEYNVWMVDFSDKEDELYFLKDIMHIGWKGWVYLDEEAYNFYKQ